MYGYMDRPLATAHFYIVDACCHLNGEIDAIAAI